MTDRMAAMLRRVEAAERELEQAAAEWRHEAAEAARVRVADMGQQPWAQQLRAEQRRLRRSLLGHIRSIGLRYWLTAPFIYALILPMALVDLFTTLYQRVCFPVYGIGRVRRADYVVIDRHLLGYLNALEKLNCVYCGYANGVIAYAREVASRTEQYFCPIKHAVAAAGAHGRTARFVAYGDAEGFRREAGALRRALCESCGKGGGTR